MFITLNHAHVAVSCSLVLMCICLCVPVCLMHYWICFADHSSISVGTTAHVQKLPFCVRFWNFSVITSSTIASLTFSSENILCLFQPLKLFFHAFNYYFKFLSYLSLLGPKWFYQHHLSIHYFSTLSWKSTVYLFIAYFIFLFYFWNYVLYIYALIFHFLPDFVSFLLFNETMPYLSLE